MPAEDNLATIRAIYEAFGTGDVETILDTVADDVDFLNQPWLGLLSPHTTGDEKRRGGDGDAQNSEPNDSIRVHK